MEDYPDDFAEVVAAERARLAEEARVAAAQSDETREAARAAVQADIQRTQVSRERVAILQQNAARVALAADKRVMEDAVIGRFFPKTVGWIVDVKSQSHSNDGEGYQSRSWVMVHGTILSPQGKLQLAKPVHVRNGDYPLTTHPALSRVLRRSSGLEDIRSLEENELTLYRQQLANFVLRKRLKI